MSETAGGSEAEHSGPHDAAASGNTPARDRAARSQPPGSDHRVPDGRATGGGTPESNPGAVGGFDDSAVFGAGDGAVDKPWAMPASVRIAQVVALGMAVVGLVCTGAAGWLSGGDVALTTALFFIPSWLLGAMALAFGVLGDGIRVAAICVAGVSVLWSVPSIMFGHPPGWLGPVSGLVVLVLLCRWTARDWFDPAEW